MQYFSTRGKAPPVGAGTAMLAGLAPDGGLYVPERFPVLAPDAFQPDAAFAATAATLLAPFFADDLLAGALEAVCAEALDFPLPLAAADGFRVLELFHGPTAAFKDVGARFLAACLARLPREGERTVLVATSGDTGGAVAAAFDGRPGFRVVLLYPRGRVSARQEAQLTCWGHNVLSLRVDGDFDDCQRMVKEAFADPALRARAGLTSANSISIGRLLPQAAYYAWAGLRLWRETGMAPGFVIPSGNLGNSLACLWARRCGLPIGPVVLATNANETVGEFFAGGPWTPRATVHTLASAMDVGNPSNMERLLHMTGSPEAARGEASAVRVSDEEIRAAIRRGPERYGQAWCPHTATAVHAWESLGAAAAERPWVVVATAHPAKFEDVVEPLVGAQVPMPPALAGLMARPRHCVDIGPQAHELAGLLAGVSA
ncbi:threonine synthase [Thioalkalivibrio sp. XN8]|uniref:threonine synthase n=1 Tax=Thioalkalivibrio sp. XN8 TaxID=2712863 RepID=UPI0013ED5218|nr:threonine synthase [Thioalkalivibrio sp. XN8]NGP53993.1 threonine synthase [Thioalkalivibrio sp. XN8]